VDVLGPTRAFSRRSQLRARERRGLRHDGPSAVFKEAAAVPIAVRITPKNMTRDDYDRVMKELEDSGSGDPEGRVFHAGYGEDEVHMFDVWDSHESFQAYHENLVGLLQGAGIDAGIVQIEPVHNTFD